MLFTVPHFDGFPAVRVRRPAIDVAELTEVITDAWLDRAPKTLRETFLRDRDDPRRALPEAGEPRVPPG